MTRYVIALLLSAVSVAAFLLGGPLKGVAVFYGLVDERVDPTVLAQQLEPHDVWFASDHGNVTAPGVMLVPGCTGTHEFHHAWAQLFVDAGFVVLLIDSFKARGVKSDAALDAVCEGEQVWGFQRAGDVLVSLDRLRDHPQINPEKLYLVGWSHGGWSVLDAVALSGRDERLPTLSTPLSNSLAGVQAVAALYPYCGFGNHFDRLGWPSDAIHGLFIVADRDRNVDPQPCIDMAQRLRAQTQSVHLLRVDADHWFDNPEGFQNVPHEYSAKATSEARETILSLFGDSNQ